MLSGIQHYCFCRRQWALIHIEQQWAENVRTLEGELLHKRAHANMPTEKRKGLIVTRSMPVHFKIMGVSGICDIVEFHKDDHGITLAGHRDLYRAFPVEYKRGKPKENHSDALQLTAQAICLEEMLCCEIREAALYYGEIRHRLSIEITDDLRSEVIKSFEEMHQLFDRHYTPKAKQTKACNACSLNEICLPSLQKKQQVNRYINRHLDEVE